MNSLRHLETTPQALSTGVRRRLTDHYGPSVDQWLRNAPRLITAIAKDWDLSVLRFHDAGWTSIIAVVDMAGEPYVLKVVPDDERFMREHTALLHWRGAPVSVLVRSSEKRRALLVRAVGGRPGGAPRPADHACRVAITLPQLHTRALASAGPVPLLRDHYAGVVRTRIRDRLARLPHHLDESATRVVRILDGEWLRHHDGGVMLHADLYAENILFDQDGEPVFIDPHPMVGDTAYDWAFWCVYYRDDGFDERLSLCDDVGAAPMDVVLVHFAILALDGYLYYLDTADPRASSIHGVLRRATEFIDDGAER